MQIEIKIDTSCTETKVVVITKTMSDDVQALVNKISEAAPDVLVGFKGETACVLDPEHVVRFYSAGQKVYAVTQEGELHVRLRLYELELRLSQRRFVRISNSEIINLKAIKAFDLSFSGTICVKLKDGSVSYVSRRYVAKIRQVLGM